MNVTILRISTVKCLEVKGHVSNVLSNIQIDERVRKKSKAKTGQNVNNWFINFLYCSFNFFCKFEIIEKNFRF